MTATGMVNPVGFVFIAIFGLPGVYFLYRAVTEFWTAYHVLTNDPVGVNEVPSQSGPIEIEGTAAVATDHGTVRTPVTDTECLVYEYEVQETAPSDDGGLRNWETLDDGNDAVPFLLEDDTGAVIVDPAGADHRFEEHGMEFTPGEKPPRRIARRITSPDETDSQDGTEAPIVADFDYEETQRLIERRLGIGEEVYVHGDVDRDVTTEWGTAAIDASIKDGADTPVFIVADSSEHGAAWQIAKRGLYETGYCAFCLFVVFVFVQASP